MSPLNYLLLLLLAVPACFDVPLHFRPTAERLIESHEVKAAETDTPDTSTFSDFSNFDTLLDDERGAELLVDTEPTTTQEPKEPKEPQEPQEPEETGEGKTIPKTASRRSKFCDDYEEHFTFYCDRAIKDIPRRVRSFCISYIANCPKRTSHLTGPSSGSRPDPFSARSGLAPIGASSSSSASATAAKTPSASTSTGGGGFEFPDITKTEHKIKEKNKNKKLRACTPDCDQRWFPHCTKSCKCDYLYPAVQRFCNPPPMPLFLETCRLWYYDCPKYERYHYASQFVRSKADKGKVLPMQNVSLQTLDERYQNHTVLEQIAHYVCSRGENMNPLPDLQCGEFPIKHSVAVQVFAATAFSLLIIFALIGNSVVMWIILSSKVMRRSFNFFLLNMAIADFLMALLNAGSTWTFNVYYDWWFGATFCPINHFFGVAPTCVSVFTMMVVSWDRCAAVVNPLRKRQMSTRITFLIISAIWVLATLISLPAALPARLDKQFFYSVSKRQLNERRICHNDFEYKFLYDNFLFAVQYVTPLFVLSFMYGRIICTFRQNSFFTNPGLTKSPQHEAKNKVIKMLGIVVLIFMVCWLPYQLYHLFLERLLTDFLVASYSYMVFYWMAMSACVYNPIIYCSFNKRFRTGFRTAFRWLPCVHFTEQHRMESTQLFSDLRLINNPALKLESLGKCPNSHMLRHDSAMAPWVPERSHRRSDVVDRWHF